MSCTCDFNFNILTCLLYSLLTILSPLLVMIIIVILVLYIRFAYFCIIIYVFCVRPAAVA